MTNKIKYLIIISLAFFVLVSCRVFQLSTPRWLKPASKKPYVQIYMENDLGCSCYPDFNDYDKKIYNNPQFMEIIKDTAAFSKVEYAIQTNKQSCNKIKNYPSDIIGAIFFYYGNNVFKRYYIGCNKKFIILDDECEMKKEVIDSIIPFIKNESIKKSLLELRKFLK